MRQSFLRLVFTLALPLVLMACAAAPSQPIVVEEAGATPIEREQPPEQQIQAPKQTQSATNALLVAANTAMQEQEPGNAIAYLERAIRIDPRNANLWISLSAAHLADHNLPAANQHARKAIALAANDENLARLAWLKMADIREAEGNLSEAKAIRRRYSSLRG